jgi:hypothetical protein
VCATRNGGHVEYRVSASSKLQVMCFGVSVTKLTFVTSRTFIREIRDERNPRRAGFKVIKLTGVNVQDQDLYAMPYIS